jgi:hypothetical protein
MKNLLTILVVLTAVCGAVNVNAIDKPKAPVGMAVVKSGSIFKVYYRGAKPGDVKVTIYNDKGVQVYKEKIHNLESFIRPYNFSTLSEGEYTVELEGEDGKQIQPLSYHITSTKKLMKLAHVTGTDNKYLLMVANKGNDVLQVKIYDGSNSLLYNTTETIQGDFGKVYNLSTVGKNFSFEVTDQNGNTEILTYSGK